MLQSKVHDSLPELIAQHTLQLAHPLERSIVPANLISAEHQDDTNPDQRLLESL